MRLGCTAPPPVDGEVAGHQIGETRLIAPSALLRIDSFRRTALSFSLTISSTGHTRVSRESGMVSWPPPHAPVIFVLQLRPVTQLAAGQRFTLTPYASQLSELVALVLADPEEVCVQYRSCANAGFRRIARHHPSRHTSPRYASRIALCLSYPRSPIRSGWPRPRGFYTSPSTSRLHSHCPED